jgi:ABC-type antimicrobial peptide transport system permease subunit
MVFTPLPQIHEPTPYVTAAVRTLGSPASLAASVRSEVAAVSRDVAVTYVRTMNEQIDAAMIRERLMATLSAAFGVLTLILSCVGLYGVTSYNVMRSTHDIGIRLALGARRGAVLFRVLSQVSVIALAGIAAGLLGSVLVSRAVSQMLFGVPATDPATLGAAVVALLTTTLLAGYFPARRAAQVDPAVTLRAE